MKTECWCAFSISALMLTSCGSVTGDAPAVTGDAPAASALPTPSIHQCDDAPSLIIESVGPEYDSIEVLTAASDIVVKVQVLRDDECIIDGEGAKIPYSISRVEVLETISGPSVSSSPLIILQPRGAQNDSTELVEGESVILFLRKEEPKGRPIDRTLEEYYIPLGWDEGVAELAGSEIRFRGGKLAPTDLDSLRGATTD